MFLRTLLLVSCLLAPPLSFADPTPVPPEKSAYVGDWKGEKMRLKISQDGRVAYKREQPGKNIDITIDLLGFNGDNFDVGFSLVRSTFVVSKPPHREGGKWKMVVDGVELIRGE
jgi:hypothetical protein